MATRKCGNIYFRQYFMAVRKFTNIFVLLSILMVCMVIGSRDTLSSFASHKRMYGPTDSGRSPNVNRQKMSPLIIKPVKKKLFINGIRGDLFRYQSAT